jgi:hypothetical protein
VFGLPANDLQHGPKGFIMRAFSIHLGMDETIFDGRPRADVGKVMLKLNLQLV